MPPQDNIHIQGPTIDASSSAITDRILRALPDWFGIESALVEYVEKSAKLPTFVSRDDAGQPTGMLSILQHAPETAEVYVVGVLPEWHGRGHGCALLDAAEAWLAERGVTFLQVKTVGPSSDNGPYARTRAWYERRGFVHLEEFPTLWDERNPCLVMIKGCGRA